MLLSPDSAAFFIREVRGCHVRSLCPTSVAEPVTGRMAVLPCLEGAASSADEVPVVQDYSGAYSNETVSKCLNRAERLFRQ